VEARRQQMKLLVTAEVHELDDTLDCDVGLAGLRRRRAPRAESHGPLQRCGFRGVDMWVRGAGSAGGLAAKPAPHAYIHGALRVRFLPAAVVPPSIPAPPPHGQSDPPPHRGPPAATPSPLDLSSTRDADCLLGYPHGDHDHSLPGGQIQQEVVASGGARAGELPRRGAAVWSPRGVLPRRLCGPGTGWGARACRPPPRRRHRPATRLHAAAPPRRPVRRRVIVPASSSSHHGGSLLSLPTSSQIRRGGPSFSPPVAQGTSRHGRRRRR
jgi:hypothetical protein